MLLSHIKLSVLVLAIVSGNACQKIRKVQRGGLPRLAEQDSTAVTPNENSPTHEQDLLEEGASLSTRNLIRFKRQSLIKSDLMRALELSKDELCKELGSKNCIDEVHHLSLGGVDAYERGVFTGISESMVTSPIALERIALSACTERARRDFTDPTSAVVFFNIPIDAKGNVTDNAGRNSIMEQVVDRLFKRLLKRTAESFEKQAFVEMYHKIGRVQATNQAYEWGRLACYVTATHLEFVFY